MRSSPKIVAISSRLSSYLPENSIPNLSSRLAKIFLASAFKPKIIFIISLKITLLILLNSNNASISERRAERLLSVCLIIATISCCLESNSVLSKPKFSSKYPNNCVNFSLISDESSILKSF